MCVWVLASCEALLSDLEVGEGRPPALAVFFVASTVVFVSGVAFVERLVEPTTAFLSNSRPNSRFLLRLDVSNLLVAPALATYLWLPDVFEVLLTGLVCFEGGSG
jgi:hypothetical protein